jgi:hypothetical protein
LKAPPHLGVKAFKLNNYTIGATGTSFAGVGQLDQKRPIQLLLIKTLKSVLCFSRDGDPLKSLKKALAVR